MSTQYTVWRFLLVAFLTPTIASARQNCSELFKIVISDLANDQLKWSSENFTNPKNHNPENYRYIIHSTGFSWRPIKQIYEFLRNPTMAPEYILSVSVVDHLRMTEPYGSLVGFILKVPSENIIAAHTQDMSVVNGWKNQLYENGGHVLLDHFGIKTRIDYERLLFKKFGLKEPKVIANPPADAINPHNEVAISKVGANGRPINVIGIFIMQDSPLELIQKYTELAAENSLPIVQLPRRSVPKFYN